MTDLLTAAQMRAIEAAAIASGAVTGLELMERAGRGVIQAVFEEWPEFAKTPHRAVVLCGPGNNGGDGFVVARLLREQGWEVEVFLYGEPERMPPDARVNYERWLGMDGDISRSPPDITAAGVHLFVDAFFGIGLTRPVPDREIRVLHEIAAKCEETGTECFPYLVAVDVPSGLDADSGKEIGQSSYCDLTVTFHCAKIGHFLLDAPALCKTVRTVDIGLKQQGLEPPANLVDFTAATRYGLRKRSWQLDGPSHKFHHGHALILSGPSGRGGAARLSARGALRIGAGLVTVAAPSDAIPEHAARLDAIMLREADGAEDLRELLSDRRINALCIGPGLGLGEDAADLVSAALEWHLPRGRALPLIDANDLQIAAWFRKHGHRPATVLDADALTLLSRDPALFAALHGGCVLTPHAGEFARLFPGIAEKLAAPATQGPAYSKVDATREAAARAGCVVLYKGPDTVIADPSGNCAINAAVYEREAPWLATAGSGDVLAGFIAGLLARGFSPFEAASTGAWLHVECARSFGPGLIAEDLPEELPKVFRALGL